MYIYIYIYIYIHIYIIIYIYVYIYTYIYTYNMYGCVWNWNGNFPLTMIKLMASLSRDFQITVGWLCAFGELMKPLQSAPNTEGGLEK